MISIHEISKIAEYFRPGFVRATHYYKNPDPRDAFELIYRDHIFHGNSWEDVLIKSGVTEAELNQYLRKRVRKMDKSK